MNKIGIDLGGTKIEGILLDEKGNELIRKRIATEQEKGYDHILKNIQTLYQELISFKKGAATFGIGTPGSLSKRTGLLKNSNTLCLNGQPLKQDLEKLLGRNVALENDANCFAMAEARLGAGKGYASVFGVIMGTGCGGGIVINGEMISGKHGIAGEWGHTTIAPHDGPKCYCGKRGCVEKYISGGGLEETFEQQFEEKLSLKNIIENFKGGKRREIAFIHDFLENFGIALSNVINILDPDIIVLGGGLSNIDELYSIGVDKVKKYVFNDTLETKIVKNICGDSAGVLGAAFIGV